jgi:CheY-like chemotaxis protein
MAEGVLRILVVEDDFLIASALVDCLKSFGHVCVGPAATVESAMALAKEESYDAAILDIRLGIDRVDPVADLVAARHIPLVFSVGNLDDVDQKRWPYAMILLKPYNEGQVGDLLGQLLGEDGSAAMPDGEGERTHRIGR